MNWTAISSVFLLATFKFMLAPLSGLGLGLSFLIAMLTSFVGATLSSAVFYFMSEYFLQRSAQKKLAKTQAEGYQPKFSKKKWVVNRTIIKIKLGIGQIGLCFLAPLFLSIPIGTIICAKFFGKKKTTYPIIVIGVAVNSFLLTLVSSLFFT